MRKNGLLFFVFIMISALSLSACDPRGDLSIAETEKLYGEIKELFTTGQIFNYQVKPSREANTVDKPVKESDIEFVKSLSEQIFDESKQLGRYGMWWDSKRACRICDIICSLPMQYDGISCTVEEFSAGKYRDGSVTVIIYYRLEGTENSDNRRIWIAFEPNQ